MNETEKNPDVATQTLYRCWDSSAVISEDEHNRSVNVSKTGDLSATQAASLMYHGRTFTNSSHCVFAMSARHSPVSIKGPLSMSQSFEAESSFIGPKIYQQSQCQWSMWIWWQ